MAVPIPLSGNHNYLFDTTVFIDFYRKRATGLQLMRQVAEQTLSVGFSFISLLELQLPTKGDWTESYQFQLLRYLPMYGCEPSVLELADHFENELALANQRRREKLSSPGTPDGIIAATASSYNLRVVTRDRVHLPQFRRFGISVEVYSL